MTIKFDQKSGILIPHAIPPLHRNSFVESPVVIQATLAPHNLIQVGAFTGIYGGRLGHCQIGRYCSIAPGVDIASDQHPADWLSTSMVQYVPDVHGWGSWLKANGYSAEYPANTFSSNSPVQIGNDVWIGQGVFVKSGVAIGDGAIVAAHSVVVNDVPPYAIVAGVPAQIKRYRFSTETIARLLSIRWWQYNIFSVANELDFAHIDNALDSIERAIAAEQLQIFEGIRTSLVEEA